ncbi:MAG TPA: hypothetical protein VMT15_18350 [Bryobacteraceae bacterium]|nr:hypothetical protein [Bryobacteraceae bacterium]
MRIGLALGLLSVLLPSTSWAQEPKRVPVPVIVAEQPDSQRVRAELSHLLDRYPPSLRRVLQLDPGLLGNQGYLAPYPALVNFLAAHPDIARNPSFYIGVPEEPYRPPDHAAQVLDMWKDVAAGLAALTAFSLGITLLVWLTRTLVDYRRWNRLAKVQTDVHTKLMDRFSSNNELLAYIQSPAGSRFLQSTPIMLDDGPRSVGAPLGRILWSLQGGVVLLAGGIGLFVVSGRVSEDAAQPLHALGVLGIALGLGFVASAIISYVISQRLGLIEPPAAHPQEQP